MANDMFARDAVHVALDLETLGTRPGSVILEIGASAFTLSNRIRTVANNFDIYIDPVKSQACGFTQDASTIEWGSKQDPELRSIVLSGTTPVFTALDNFKYFLEKLGEKKNVFIWANSPSFDCTLLKSYYDYFGVDIPWDFRNERDLRTLAACFPFRYEEARKIYTNQRPHNGYWDARYEADIISHILKVERSSEI